MTTYTQTQGGCHPVKLCRLYMAGYVCGYRITKMSVVSELEEIQIAGVKCHRITVSGAEVVMTAVVIAMFLGSSPSKLGGLGIHCMLFLAVAVDYALCLWAFRVLRTNNHCWDCFSREKQAINSDRNRNPNGMVKIRT